MNVCGELINIFSFFQNTQYINIIENYMILHYTKKQRQQKTKKKIQVKTNKQQKTCQKGP